MIVWGAVFAMIIGAGVYAVVTGDARNIVFSAIAVIIFGVILVVDRRRKRLQTSAGAPAPSDSAPVERRAGKPERSGRSLAKMLGWLVPLIAIIAVALVGALPDQSEEQKVGEYNQLVDRITTVQAHKQAVMGEFSSMLADDPLAPLATRKGAEVRLGDPSAAQVTALLPVVLEARSILAQSMQDSAELAELWGRTAQLETGAERDTYARQRKDLEELEGQLASLTDRYFATLEQAYAQDSLGEADRVRVQQELSSVATESDALQARLEELARASEEYYRQHF